MNCRSPWPKEQEIMLYELRAKGLKVSAIAREMSQHFSRLITANILVKKLARDRLRAANASVTKDMDQSPLVETKILVPVGGEESRDSSPLLGKAFSDLKFDECQYEITGTRNKREYRFCGEKIENKMPYKYCHEHRSRCYYPKELTEKWRKNRERSEERRKNNDRSHKR